MPRRTRRGATSTTQARPPSSRRRSRTHSRRLTSILGGRPLWPSTSRRARSSSGQNPTLALVPASAEKLAVSFAALRLLGPGFRFRTEVVGVGRARRESLGRRPLCSSGSATRPSAVADLDALARDVAAWGIRRVAGRVLGDETPLRHPAGRAGLEALLPRRRVEAALGSLRRRGRVPRSERLGRSRGRARSPLRSSGAASPSTGRRGRGVPRRRFSARTRSLRAARRHRPADEPRERQLRRRDAAQGARSERRRAVERRRRARRSCRRRSRMPAWRSTAYGSPTAPASRCSIGLRRWRSSPSCAPALAIPSIRDAFVTSLSVAGDLRNVAERLGRRPTRGRVIAKTGTTAPRLLPRRDSSGAATSFADHPERLAGPVLVRARCPGSLRDRPSAFVARGGAQAAGLGEDGHSEASRAFCSLRARVTLPTTTPVVFFETDSGDLGAERLERRLRLFARPSATASSVPVMTY